MINHLTASELKKINEITERLNGMLSPVLRLQAILQFSQIVDILAIGDSSQPMCDILMNDIDTLESKVNECEEFANLIGGEGAILNH